MKHKILLPESAYLSCELMALKNGYEIISCVVLNPEYQQILSNMCEKHVVKNHGFKIDADYSNITGEVTVNLTDHVISYEGVKITSGIAPMIISDVNIKCHMQKYNTLLIDGDNPFTYFTIQMIKKVLVTFETINVHIETDNTELATLLRLSL